MRDPLIPFKLSKSRFTVSDLLEHFNLSRSATARELYEFILDEIDYALKDDSLFSAGQRLWAVFDGDDEKAIEWVRSAFRERRPTLHAGD